jgi:aminoglycoside 6'-N-acetyltransferase
LYRDVALRNHEHLARFESGNAAFSIQTEGDAADVLREFRDAWSRRQAFFLGVFRKCDDAFVAQVYVGVASESLPGFMVGFFADCRHEGQGYVSEAVRTVLHSLFKTLGAHRVGLWCSDVNERSRRVAERCGFQREGHIREDKRFPDGTVAGSLCYGMLRLDFEAAEEARPSAL